MGLRCSLLGHDYGEPFVERDREERGNEVVVTERELEECERCGAEKVTSENTEVRSLRSESGDAEPSRSTPDAAGSESAEPAAGEPTGESASPGASDRASGGPDQSPGTQASSGASERSASGDAGGAFTSPTDAIEHAEPDATGDAVAGDADGDDAVILDDDAADEPGSDQWDEPAEPEADPEPEPEPVDDDAEVVDAGGGGETASRQDRDAEAARADRQARQPGDQQAPTGQGGASADRSRGEWPDPEGDDEGFDATGDAEGGRDAGSRVQLDDSEDVVESDAGFTSAGPLDNTDRADVDELDFALFCPECGFERYAAGSSLRAGDICPECQRGYLAEEQ